MSPTPYKLDSKTFPYLSESEVQKINEGFDRLGIPLTEEYPGAAEFSKRFEKPSVLTSEGINYTLTGSSSEAILHK